MKVRGSIGIRSLLGNVVFGTVVTAIPVVVLAAQIPTTSARYDINLSGTFDPVNDTNIVNTNSAPSTTTSNSDGTSSCIVNACSGATGSSTASADFGTLRAGSTGAVAGTVTGPTGASVGGSYSGGGGGAGCGDSRSSSTAAMPPTATPTRQPKNRPRISPLPLNSVGMPLIWIWISGFCGSTPLWLQPNSWS